MRALVHIRFVLLAVAIGAVFGASPARAAVGWELPPATVAPSGVSAGITSTAEPTAALTSDGTRGVLWGTVGTSAGSSVQVAVRSAGGTFSTSTLEGVNSHSVRFLSLTADASDGLLAVWGHDGETVVRAAYRPSGGEWTALADVPVDDPRSVVVASAPNGTAYLAFPSGNNLMLSVRPPGTAGFPAPSPVLNVAALGGIVAVAANDAGEAMLVYHDRLASTTQGYRRDPNTGGWAAAGTLPDSGQADMAMDAEGNAFIAWITTSSGSTSTYKIANAYAPAGGSFGTTDGSRTAVTVSGSGTSFRPPSVAFDRQGVAHLFYGRFDSTSGGSLREATRQPGSTTTSTDAVLDSGSTDVWFSGPRLIDLGDGTLLLAAVRRDVVTSYTRAPDGTWGGGLSLGCTTPDQPVTLRTDGVGHALASWWAYNAIKLATYGPAASSQPVDCIQPIPNPGGGTSGGSSGGSAGTTVTPPPVQDTPATVSNAPPAVVPGGAALNPVLPAPGISATEPVRVAGAVVRTGLVAVCPPGGPACDVLGTARLTGASAGAAAMTKAGRIHMSIPAGRRAGVRFTLTSRARTALGRRGRLRVVLAVQIRAASSVTVHRTITIRARRPQH